MKKFLLLLAAALILSSCVSSKRVIQLERPVLQRTDSIDISSYLTKYGTYDGVYLEIQQAIDHYGNKSNGAYSIGSWNFTNVMRRKYIVLNPEAQNLTTFMFSVPKNAVVGKVFMILAEPNGNTTQYSLTDMIKETDSDGYLKYKFVYPHITKGCVIHEGFEVTYSAASTRPPLAHDLSIEFNLPCEKYSFTYAYPDWWNIKIKHIAKDKLPGLTERLDNDSHKRIFTYTANNLAASKKEEYSPFSKEVEQYLEFMVTEMDMVTWYYKSPKNWKELVSSFEGYILDRDGFLSTRVSRTTDEILKGVTDPKAMIDTVVSYIQNNIEIARDGEDRNFAEILTDKKGSMYAITGLAHSMFKKAGFKPQYVLVHSADEGYFDPSFLNISQFTIPAVIVPVDTQNFVLMPYRKDLQVDIIPEIIQGQPAMVVDKNATVQFRSIPDYGGASTNIQDDYDVTLSEEGSLTVTERTTLTGTSSLIFRNLLKNLNEKEKEQFIKKRVTSDGLDATITGYTFLNEKEYKKPLIITINYTVENLAMVSDNEVVFQHAGLFSPTSIKDLPIETEKRKNPIRIYFNEEFTKSIALHYPAQWKLATDLPSKKVENIFGSLATEYKTEPGLITAAFHRKLIRSTQPKEKTGELVSLVGKNSSASLPTIILKINAK